MLEDYINHRQISTPQKVNDETLLFLQVNPDVRFRLIGENPTEMQHLDVSWYVTTREDVGGFRAAVYNVTSGKEVAEHNLTYVARNLATNELPRGRWVVTDHVNDF